MGACSQCQPMSLWTSSGCRDPGNSSCCEHSWHGGRLGTPTAPWQHARHGGQQQQRHFTPEMQACCHWRLTSHEEEDNAHGVGHQTRPPGEMAAPFLEHSAICKLLPGLDDHPLPLQPPLQLCRQHPLLSISFNRAPQQAGFGCAPSCQTCVHCRRSPAARHLLQSGLQQSTPQNAAP